MQKVIQLNWLLLQEKNFAKRLAEFLPKGLTIRSYPGYFFIGENGISGLIKDDVADFDGNQKIVIHKPKWEAQLKASIQKYTEVYGTNITILIG